MYFIMIVIGWLHTCLMILYRVLRTSMHYHRRFIIKSFSIEAWLFLFVCHHFKSDYVQQSLVPIPLLAVFTYTNMLLLVLVLVLVLVWSS